MLYNQTYIERVQPMCRHLPNKVMNEHTTVGLSILANEQFLEFDSMEHESKEEVEWDQLLYRERKSVHTDESD